MKVLAPLDLNRNELRNAVIQNLATPPSSPVEGLFYYGSAVGDKKLYYYNGTSFISLVSPISAHSGLSGLLLDDHTQYLHLSNARIVTAVHTFNPSSTGSPFALGANAIGQLVTGLNADKVDGLDASAFALSGHTHVASNITDFSTAVQATRLDQFAAPTSAVSLNSQKITNLSDPTNPQDAATKNYVDAARSGLDLKDSVRAATTANITLSGLQTVDGVVLIAGDRVLVKNQTVASQNGVYVVAVGAWTRASDADSNAEVNAGLTTFIEEGTQGDTRWSLITPNPIVLGTTALSFAKDGAVAGYTSSNVNVGGVGVFKQLSGTNFEFRGINAASNKISVVSDVPNNEIDIDVVEANLTITNLAGTLTVAKGGTGGTSAATARSNLGATTKFAQDIGDGSATTIAVSHNLNTTDVIVTVKTNASPFDIAYPDVRITDANTVTLVFSVAPTSAQYRVIVIG